MSRDPSILGAPANNVEALLDFDGTVCEGIYKLVQRVLILMFTDGEGEFAFGIGTDIPNLLQGTNALAGDVMQNQFAIAANILEEIFKTTVTSTTPDDEILQTITIQILEADAQFPDEVVVSINVKSRAGEDVTVKVPINFEG